MALIVQKYGGTSVGTVERIEAVAEKIIATKNKGNQVVVVVSAMSGETNRLIGLAEEIQETKTPAGRELDVLVSTGEQVTIALLSMALQKRDCNAVSCTGGQLNIRTDNKFNKARIQDIDGDRLKKLLNDGNVVVVAGFQGVDSEGNITTLGRGGSDTTAVALAAAAKADECQIYTDVDGVYTTDPRVEPNARRLSRITFEEMLEMASLGSKVLQIRAVEFAGKYDVPLRVLSSFKDGPGTLITYEDDMIVQNIGRKDTADFTFTVHRNDYDKALKILENTAKKLGGGRIGGDPNIVKLSIVGVGMRSHAGIASRMFKALADEKINILMISTSEIKISVVIEEKYLELGVRTLHEEFELDQATEETN